MHPRILLFWIFPVLIAAATIQGHYRYQEFRRRVEAGDRKLLIRMYRNIIVLEILWSFIAWFSVGPHVLAPPPGSSADDFLPVLASSKALSSPR